MEFVRCTTADGHRLDGVLYRVPNQPQAGATTVIMHHGVGGSFYTPGFFEDAVAPLLARGFSVLRANNRGHDIVSRASVGGYVGAAYEAMDDCHADWDAWCNLAAEQGAEKIVLWGHSLGAVKNILYAARSPHAAVMALVASSPPRFSYSQFSSNEEEWPEFETSLTEATKAIDRAPDTLMSVKKPTPLLIAAERFVEKYGPSETYDYVVSVPAITLPLLITIGSKEGVEVRPGLSRLAFWGAHEYLPALANAHTHVSFATVAGGDHAYTGVTGPLAETVLEFLAEHRGTGTQG